MTGEGPAGRRATRSKPVVKKPAASRTSAATPTTKAATGAKPKVGSAAKPKVGSAAKAKAAPVAKPMAKSAAAAAPKSAASKPKSAASKPKAPSRSRTTTKPKATSGTPKSKTKATATEAPAATGAPATAPAPSTSAVAAPASNGIVLYLLRHADAGDPATWVGEDADRPLSKKGRKQSRRLGSHLDALGLEVTAILTSPKVRAADTARLVGKALGVKPATEDRLRDGFDPAALAQVLGWLGPSASSVMLVGHDPDFSSLASWLTDAPVALRKGALARIDLPNRNAIAGSGALRWLLPPDAVKA